MSWQPTASIANLRARAQILEAIRCFFKSREVMEVQTPILGHTTATDPHIDSIRAANGFLQTSPEFAMKRLLAAGSGAIFEITKAFRQEESGRYHNPEFTMLEWYRPGFDHHDLMAEVNDLLTTILQSPPANKISYRELFLQTLNIDPFTAPATTDLDALFSLEIMHHLGHEQPLFIYDYPADQAALAKIREDSPPCAERFECFYKGIELANGYHELCNPDEQRQRFEKDNAKRQQMGKPTLPIDEALIAALEHGMPSCAGVALGVDRLMMLATEADSIQQVMVS